MQNPFEAPTPRDPDLGNQINDIEKTHTLKAEFIKETQPEIEQTISLNKRLSEFKGYLNNKTVALIGRASYLATEEYGEEIDSFDVVIRIHTWQIHRTPENYQPLPEHESLAISGNWYVPALYQRNVGSKTDVLYLRLQWIDYATLTKTLEILNHDKTAWLGVETFAEMACAAPQHHFIEKHWGPIHVIPIGFFNAVAARLNYAEPLPGTTIAAFLAGSQAKAVKIFGCPCYQDTDGKTEHAKLQIQGKHNTLADFHYMRQLVQRDNRFSCDPIMMILFSSEIS